MLRRAAYAAQGRPIAFFAAMEGYFLPAGRDQNLLLLMAPFLRAWVVLVMSKGDSLVACGQQQGEGGRR